jgi:hypothetical protein
VTRTEKEIDRLFTLPLSEFTEARNALAKQLKKDGDGAGAERVRSLRKPPAPVWAINQAVRSDAAATRDLLKAAQALRAAQQRALGKQRSGEAVREARDRERQAVQRLAQAAQAALEKSGGTAGSAQLEKIERTLGTAALDDEARPLLKAGRLTDELQPAGFEALAGMQLGGPPPDGAEDGRQGSRGDEAARRRQRRALQERAHEAERRASAAEREADEAEDVARRARAAAGRARAEADEAAAALGEAD